MTGASVSLLSGLQSSLLPLRHVQPLPEHTGGTLVPGHGLLASTEAIPWTWPPGSPPVQ